MICWRCHSNSINPGSRLPNISDVKTRKRRNVVEIDMIRNNRIDDLVLSRQDHSDFFNVLCWFGFREFSSTRYYVSLVYICEIWKNGTVFNESASVTLHYFYLSRSIVGVFENLTTMLLNSWYCYVPLFCGHLKAFDADSTKSSFKQFNFIDKFPQRARH